MLCGVGTHDGACRALARNTGFLVASLEYRLAPEHPVPAPQRDVLAAYAHLLRAADALTGGARGVRVAVAGDSAGGNLAASLCLSLAMAAAGNAEAEFVAPLHELRRLPQPAFQLLIYPACDLPASLPSHKKYARGWFLSARLREFFWKHYLGPAGPSRDALSLLPLLSPLRAGPTLLGAMAPALVMTAEHDVLHDEGVALVEAIRRGGGKAWHMEGSGLYHGFANNCHIAPAARQMQDFAYRAAALDAELRA